jgi:PAS domain S-box-containing protein
LIWRAGLPSDRSAPRIAEAGILLIALATIGQIIFGGQLDYSYILFPCIVWAALRFGQHGATMAILLTTSIAVWDTANGSGPFAQGTLYQSLFFVQTFIGTIALTGLVLAAIMAERRHAEDALRASDRSLKQAHDQLAAILENAPAVAIQIYDERGAITYWNRASQQLYGFSAEAVRGRRLGGLLLSEADAHEFEQLVLTLVATNQPTPVREWVNTTADGTLRYVMSSAFPIGSDRETRQVVCMEVDITERKRVEAALRESDHALRRQNTYLTDLHETTLALMNRLDLAGLLETIVARPPPL